MCLCGREGIKINPIFNWKRYNISISKMWSLLSIVLITLTLHIGGANFSASTLAVLTMLLLIPAKMKLAAFGRCKTQPGNGYYFIIENGKDFARLIWPGDEWSELHHTRRKFPWCKLTRIVWLFKSLWGKQFTPSAGFLGTTPSWSDRWVDLATPWTRPD